MAAARLCLTALLASGCMTSFSPPTRTLQAGMPGGLAASRTELSVAAMGYGIRDNAAAPGMLGLNLGRALSSTFAIEGGTTLFFGLWWMGWAGLRVTRIVEPFAVDAELGFGAGVGGFGDPAGRRWLEVPAYGGYLGFGAGVRPTRWLGLYARLRAEASNGIRYTLWSTAVAGAELSFWKDLAAGVSGGVTALDWRREWGWVYQAHFTVRL